MTATLYDRTRAWSDRVGLTDPKKELLYVLQECGELDDAISGLQSTSFVRGERYDRLIAELKDAIGDVAVTLTVEQHLHCPEVPLETLTGQQVDSVLSALGLLAEGLCKPKKVAQVSENCANLLATVKAIAEEFGFDFERDCFGPALAIIEARVYDGKLVDGTFVKAGDY